MTNKKCISKSTFKVIGGLVETREYIFKLIDVTISFCIHKFKHKISITEENKEDIKIYASPELCTILEINDEFHIQDTNIDFTKEIDFDNTPIGLYKGIPVYRQINLTMNFLFIVYRDKYYFSLLFETSNI